MTTTNCLLLRLLNGLKPIFEVFRKEILDLLFKNDKNEEFSFSTILEKVLYINKITIEDLTNTEFIKSIIRDSKIKSILC